DLTDVEADAHDLARSLHPQSCRKAHGVRGGFLVLTLAGVNIHEIDPGVVHLNHRFARTRLRHGKIPLFEDRRIAVTADTNRLHRRTSRVTRRHSSRLERRPRETLRRLRYNFPRTARVVERECDRPLVHAVARGIEGDNARTPRT